MKHILFSILAIFLALPIAEVGAQKNANTTTRPPQKQVTAKGIALQKNRATPKPGYKFEKTSDTTFVVRRAKTGSTTGLGFAIQCRCSEGVPSTCIAEISSNEAKCKGDTCCSFRLVNNTPKVKAQ